MSPLPWATAAAGADRRLRYLALAVAWLALWRVSALMQYDAHASLWFPPAGLTFAALLVLGWRAVPVLMACAVAVTFWVDAMYGTGTRWRVLLSAGMLFGAAHCLSYGLGAALLKRVIRRTAMHALPTIVMAFLATTGLAALSATLLGIQSLVVTGMLDAKAQPSLWLPWWIGDMTGAQVMAPLFIGLLSWRYGAIEPWLRGLTFQPQGQGHGSYAFKLALNTLLVCLVLLLAARLRHSDVAFGLFFLIIPQMWVVYTESPFRSAVSLALFSTVTAGLVAALGLMQQALVYQFAISVIAASAYFGLAVPALIAQNRHLSELALSDGLTKVATKMFFFERAERELRHAREAGRPVSLIVLDIDRFKQINDNYGHAVGDRALILLARTVRMQLRQSDVVGRFGGDEFMLLLPDLDLPHARSLAERLRHTLGRTPVPGTQHVLSTSFGVATVTADETIAQAFRRADDKLLDAKRGGRNRVLADDAA